MLEKVEIDPTAMKASEFIRSGMLQVPLNTYEGGIALWAFLLALSRDKNNASLISELKERAGEHDHP